MTLRKKPLAGKRVAIAGDRRFDDIEKLTAKQGAIALARPMMHIAPLDAPETLEAVQKLCDEGCDWLILVTGMGTRALVKVAETLGRKDELLARLHAAKLAARGYKTVKALNELGLQPAVKDDDGTVRGLQRKLEALNLMGQSVALKLHGERLPELTTWLAARGASVFEIPLYRYRRPTEDEVNTLYTEIITGEVDAVAFTANTQVKYLFEAAEALGGAEALTCAFAHAVQAVSVGHMTSAALRAWGVSSIVEPQHERMGAMITEFAQHEQRRSISS